MNSTPFEQAQAFCVELPTGSARVTAADAEPHFERGMSLLETEHATLHLDRLAFSRHVARCVESLAVEQHAVLEALEKLRWADLGVAFGAISGSSEAWRILDTQYFSESVRVLGRLQLTQSQLDDVCQHTRTRLFLPGPRGVAKLQQYMARGSLTAWLKMVVTRDAIDMLSKKEVELPAFGDDFWDALPASQDDSEMALLRRQYGAQLKDTVESVVADMHEEHRCVLRYHLVEGLTIDDIAMILGVHRATVARRINKARDEMAKTTRERMREHLQVSASQFASVMRLIDTQIDLSLHRLL